MTKLQDPPFTDITGDSTTLAEQTGDARALSDVTGDIRSLEELGFVVEEEIEALLFGDSPVLTAVQQNVLVFSSFGAVLFDEVEQLSLTATAILRHGYGTNGYGRGGYGGRQSVTG